MLRFLPQLQLFTWVDTVEGRVLGCAITQVCYCNQAIDGHRVRHGQSSRTFGFLKQHHSRDRYVYGRNQCIYFEKGRNPYLHRMDPTAHRQIRRKVIGWKSGEFTSCIAEPHEQGASDIRGSSHILALFDKLKEARVTSVECAQELSIVCLGCLSTERLSWRLFFLSGRILFANDPLQMYGGCCGCQYLPQLMSYWVSLA